MRYPRSLLRSVHHRTEDNRTPFRSSMPLVYSLSERGTAKWLTWVGVGVTGTSVPVLMVVAYPDFPMLAILTHEPDWNCLGFFWDMKMRLLTEQRWDHPSGYGDNKSFPRADVAALNPTVNHIWQYLSDHIPLVVSFNHNPVSAKKDLQTHLFHILANYYSLYDPCVFTSPFRRLSLLIKKWRSVSILFEAGDVHIELPPCMHENAGCPRKKSPSRGAHLTKWSELFRQVPRWMCN